MCSLTKIYVGIDYHHRTSAVCALDGEGNLLFQESRCTSDACYIDKYVRWMAEFKEIEIHATVEACGGSAKLVEDLRNRGWRIVLCHAATVARLAKNIDKTDKQDAYVLADLVRVGYVPTVFLAPENQRQLRSLTRYRQQLAAQRTQLKQRVRGLMREAHLRIFQSNAWTRSWVGELCDRLPELGEHRAWIAQQYVNELDSLAIRLAAVEQRLQLAVDQAPGSAWLLARPGVGVVTAAMLLAEIGDFHRFRNGKQLARYCGMAPVNESSGDRDRQKGIGRACNSDLRRILIELSHRLTRYVPRWREMKRNLVARGKPKSVAVVAVANRWLRRLQYEMTTQAFNEATT